MSIAITETHAERFARAKATLGIAEHKSLLSPSSAHEVGSIGERERFNVPEPLYPLFPSKALYGGNTLGICGPCSTSLTLAFAAAAMGEESWCVFVGFPHLGLAALQEHGVDVSRTALIPDPGAFISPVLSALIDGLDIVILGTNLALTPALWRTAAARARTRKTLLIAQHPPIAGSKHFSYDQVITATHDAWVGLGEGSGRLRFRTIHVSLSGRGVFASHASTVIRMPTTQGGIASVSPCHTAPPKHTSARLRLALVKSAA